MGMVANISESFQTPLLEVRGNSSLFGEIKISGAKNSALVLMAASLLTEEEIELNNIPLLTDIQVMVKILLKMRVKITREGNTLFINPKHLHPVLLPAELVHSLRASFFCIGPLLAKTGKAKLPLPGGCNIGIRPVDQHIKGLRALGASVKIEEDVISAFIPGNKNRLTSADIILDCPSVGATETILMAASLADGTTTIKNAAKEPEVQDLVKMLNQMGAKISGAGTSLIKVTGVKTLRGCSHKAIPDRIEAGTFLIAAAITQSTLEICPVIPEHLSAVINKLKECGCSIEEKENSLKIYPGELKGVDITTEPFPGFPTDLQAPFMALMSIADGESEIRETIFENRMQHVCELQKMGASIEIINSIAKINGVSSLKGSSLCGGDLRSTAAIILATLAAKGTSTIQGLNHLDRGYESFEDKLNFAGANISRHLNNSSNNNVSGCEPDKNKKLGINQDAA